jgi:hypothetical protein
MHVYDGAGAYTHADIVANVFGGLSIPFQFGIYEYKGFFFFFLRKKNSVSFIFYLIEHRTLHIISY